MARKSDDNVFPKFYLPPPHGRDPKYLSKTGKNKKCSKFTEMAQWGSTKFEINKWTSQEDDLKGRQSYKKRTLQEDRKKALQEEDITRNLTFQKDDIAKRQPNKKTGRRLYWKMTSACHSCTELGPAQPQLVLNLLLYNILM